MSSNTRLKSTGMGEVLFTIYAGREFHAGTMFTMGQFRAVLMSEQLLFHWLVMIFPVHFCTFSREDYQWQSRGPKLRCSTLVWAR